MSNVLSPALNSIGGGLENPALFWGTRANIPRMEAIVKGIHERGLPIRFVNTNQHWSPELVGDWFGPIKATELNVRSSDVDKITEASYRYLEQSVCDSVIVYGDTASALGPARAANKLGLKLVHLEAGFRTYDAKGQLIVTGLPEEAIRREIDELSDVLVPLLPSAARTLHEERRRGLVHGYISEPLGHPLADSVINHFPYQKQILTAGLLTVHREANVRPGPRSGLAQILEQVNGLKGIQWRYPIHPKAEKYAINEGLWLNPDRVHCSPPLPHGILMKEVLPFASIVVSDSAGLQVESVLSGRRLVIPRSETEYPDLLGNTSVLCAPHEVAAAVRRVREASLPDAAEVARLHAEFGGGQASRRIVDFIAGLIRNA